MFHELDTLQLRYVDWTLGMNRPGGQTRTAALAEAGLSPLQELALTQRVKYAVSVRKRDARCLARRTYERELAQWHIRKAQHTSTRPTLAAGCWFDRVYFDIN